MSNFNISQSQFQSLLQWSKNNGGSSSANLNISDMANLYNNDTALTTDEKTMLGEISNDGTSTTSSQSSLLNSISGGATTLNWTQLGTYENQQNQSLTTSLNQLSTAMGILPDYSSLGMDSDDPDQCDGVNVQFSA